MMSFFPASFCAPAPAADLSYTPLFRLLEDFDNYSREAKTTPAPANPRKRARQTRPATFKPSFDVRETESTYELYGELPGLERENLSIEFTEPQTMAIRGRIEHKYNTPATETTTTETTTVSDNASTISDTSTADGFTEVEKPRRSSYQATVEDDPEDEHTPATSPALSPKSQPAVPVPVAKAQPETQEVAPQQPAQAGPKVLLSERLVGEFSRVFTFPARVDHDGVAASLNNGILSVTVPKAKPMTRRIAIV